MASSISMIGLGQMGAALARAQIAAGREVVVWNRSPARAEPFAREGVKVAGSLEEAIAASDVIIVCVLDYVVTEDLFRDPGSADLLRGKTIVQLTSGTAGDARRLDVFFGSFGAGYLDGAILAYPKDVGKPEAPVLYSGPKEIFDRVEPALRSFGGGTTYVGEAIGAASTLDAALLSFYYGSMLAFLHGVALTESEDMPRETFVAFAPAVVKLVADTLPLAASQIGRADYRGDQATLDIHAAALRHIARMSLENSTSPEIPEVALRFFERAIEQGHGAGEIAAAVEAIRAIKR